jgi:uncharacterized protein (TIGR03089 family)
VQADQLPGAVPRAGIGALIERQMGRYGDKPFLTHYDDDRGERVELSYRTFENWTAKIANLLAEELGAAEGARIAVLVGNTWRAVAISFGCWRAGGCLVPLEEGTPPEAVASMLRRTGCAAAFVAEEGLAGLAAALQLQGTPAAERPVLVAVGSGLLGRTAVDPATALDFATVVPGMGDMFESTGGLASEALLVDTTVTQRDLLAVAGAAADELDLGEGDRLLTGLPMHGLAGLAAGLVAPFGVGSGVVLSRRLDPGAFWKRLADERVALAVLAREQVEAVVEAGGDPAGLDLERLRTVAVSPGPVPEALAAAWGRRFPVPLSPAAAGSPRPAGSEAAR